MLRPALILLTLFLASCVSASAQEKQDAREGAGEIQQEDARPAVTLLLPKTLVCVFPGGPHTKAHEQRQPIPPGKQLKDFCPHGASAFLDFGSPPLSLRPVSHLPPPPDLDTTGPHETQPCTGSKTPMNHPP
jgi:hypothetical protein